MNRIDPFSCTKETTHLSGRTPFLLSKVDLKFVSTIQKKAIERKKPSSILIITPATRNPLPVTFGPVHTRFPGELLF
jgi:hypothetical protein